MGLGEGHSASLGLSHLLCKMGILATSELSPRTDNGTQGDLNVALPSESSSFSQDHGVW